MLKLSTRARSIPQALSVQINQMVYEAKRKGRDIITLSLGEAFFDIPIFPFDWSRGYHYSDSQGIPELREKIREYYEHRYDRLVQDDCILISAGSKPIIFMAMQAILDPGDVVAIHEPAWLSYQEQARLCGAKVVFIPHDVPVNEFYRYKAKLLIINNPNNPAGRVYSEAELQECRKLGSWLLVDEAYGDFVLDDSFYSMANHRNTVVVNSMSKTWGMSGWRVGYAIAEPEFIQALLKINQHIITCGPTVLLQYLAEHFEGILEVTLPQVQAVVEKRKRIAYMLDRLGIRYLPGSATFYFFLDLRDYTGNVHELALYLLREKGVALVPGSAYGASTEKFLRLSMGTESEERIEKALTILREAIDVRPC